MLALETYFEGVDCTVKSSFKFHSVRKPDQYAAAFGRLRTGFIRNEIGGIQLSLDQLL